MRKTSQVQFTIPNGHTSTEIIEEEEDEDEEDDYLNAFKKGDVHDEDDDDTVGGEHIPMSSSHIFSSQTSAPFGINYKLDPRQELLFNAVEANDLEKVRGLMCGELPAPDVNGSNQQRRSPLIVAIRAKHLDMIMLLLQCGAAVGDALLHAVETGSPAIVRLICNYLQPSKKALKTTLDGFALDTSFLPAVTPLMYAAKENNHEMIKMLVEYGAELPSLEAVLSRTTGKTSYEDSVTRLFWHQAISSEAYLLHATDDPVQAAFNAGRVVKKCEENQLPHLKEGYEQLLTNLDNFIARYLELARNSGEIHTLLCEEEPRASPTKARQSTLPQRVLDALQLKYKQVIAHPNCMHFVLDRWYHPNWQDLTMLMFLVWTCIIILCQPILCILYIVYPFKFVRRSLKTPYVRFLMHWVSRLVFILFLMFSNISRDALLHIEPHMSACAKFKKHITHWPDPIITLIYLWIVGLTWRETKELYTQGFKSYFKDIFNFIDCVQLTLYWTSIATSIHSWRNLNIDCEVLSGASVNATQESVQIYDTTWNTTLNTTWNATDVDSSNFILVKDFHLEGPYDPLLISQAAFAVATVLTFMSSLRDIVVLAFVGPLRVSLGGMITDIVTFVFLFAFVWISFGIGMTHLYQAYDMINQVACEADMYQQLNCEQPKFASFADSMETLFWSLFGPIDLEELDVTNEFRLTSKVGVFLYGAYMTVAALVMLNALIAMMSNTYTRVEENSEIEWRVSRTRLMAEYTTKSATLPPPFNLIPTLKTLRRLVVAPYYCFHPTARRRKQMEKKAKLNSRGRRQGKYKIFMCELTDRFIMHLETEEDEDHTQKIKEDITSLHESLIAVRNEMHDIRTENAELCDNVRDLCQLFKRSTSSIAIQTESIASEEHLLNTNTLGRSETMTSQLSVASSTGKKKSKVSGLGKKFSKFVSHKSHRGADFDST